MGEPIKTEYRDLGGGVNEGVAASEIADNEFQSIQNFFPFGRKLVRRKGTARLSSAAYAENITGIMNLKESATADPVTVLGALTGFAKKDGATLTALVNQDGGVLTSDDHPWVMLQYNAIGYALRANAGLRRFTSEIHSRAGITEPATAPTLAQGGAGVITAGDYRGVATFYNTNTGAESNPSDVSNTLTLAADKIIDWSAIPVSTEYQVNARRLYRTVPDQQGTYLFVAQINDNFTTTYSDNVSIDDLGDFASFDNDLPPSGLEIGDVFSERLFASDGIDLFYSEPFMLESFGSDSILRINPDDGHRISAVHADGARLVVAKTNKIHSLTGTDRSNFALETISDRHGCYSHHSMKSAEGQLLWYGGNSFYRIYGGGQPESIATVKLKRTLERIPDDRKPYVVSAIYPKYGWYLSAVTLDSGDRNNTVLCYNYKSDSWCSFTFPDDAPAIFGEVFDSDLAQIIYCAFYDAHLYQNESGLTDFGNAITAKFRTKAYRSNQIGLMSALRRFYIDCTSVAASFVARSYKNGSNTHTKQKSALSLYYPNESVKGYEFFARQGGASWALEMEYSGTPHIEIEALAFETIPLNRRVRVR